MANPTLYKMCHTFTLIEQIWKIYRLDWAKSVRVGRFRGDTKGNSGIFESLEYILWGPIELKIFVIFAILDKISKFGPP